MGTGDDGGVDVDARAIYEISSETDSLLCVGDDLDDIVRVRIGLWVHVPFVGHGLPYSRDHLLPYHSAPGLDYDLDARPQSVCRGADIVVVEFLPAYILSGFIFEIAACRCRSTC